MSAAPASIARPFAAALVEHGRRDPSVVCLTNDLTGSCEADDFRAAFPDRFFPVGMAEQNLIGVAAGMAREGLTPFVPTFGVFATRRPYEQIALSVAYPRLRVRLCGFLPGLMTPGGPTHQATDDLGLMTQLPNMVVLEMTDATEVRSVFDHFERTDAPIYCRMLRGEVPHVFDTPFVFRRMRRIRPGSDVLIVSSGTAYGQAAAAAETLASRGIAAGHVNVTTLKPFDDETLFEAIATARRVVTVENHLIRGGLGSAVAEAIAEHGLEARLERVGIRDTFTHGGSADYLARFYGLSAADVVRAVERLLKLDATGDDDLTAAAVAPAMREAVAEGL